MTIDPEKLEEAIKEFEEVERRWALNSNQKVLLAAARFHLSTIPRYKEVEVSQWATFTADGKIWSSAMTEQEAYAEAHNNPKVFVVRLTGTAKVRA